MRGPRRTEKTIKRSVAGLGPFLGRRCRFLAHQGHEPVQGDPEQPQGVTCLYLQDILVLIGETGRSSCPRFLQGFHTFAIVVQLLEPWG